MASHLLELAQEIVAYPRKRKCGVCNAHSREMVGEFDNID